MSSRSGFGYDLRQNCRIFRRRQNCQFLAKTLANSLQPSIHIKLNEASRVLIFNSRSQQQFIKCETRMRKLELFCSLPNPCNRTPGQWTRPVQERNTDQSVGCLTRDQRIAAARKAQLSGVWSDFNSTRSFFPKAAGEESCFLGVVGPTVEQDRLPSPPPTPPHNGESWCDLACARTFGEGTPPIFSSTITHLTMPYYLVPRFLHLYLCLFPLSRFSGCQLFTLSSCR